MNLTTSAGQTIYGFSVPTPFPVGAVNVYLVEGDGWTLVDTGPHSHKALQAVEEGLRERKLSWKDIQHIVITHGHMDHHGLLAALLEKTEAKVYVHALDVAKVANYERHFFAVRERYEHFLRLCGVAKGAITGAVKTHELLKPFCKPAHVDVALKEGDQLAGSGLRVRHTPGHQEGSICLAAEDVLLTGDHILEHITPNPFCQAIAPFCGLKHYLESLHKIREQSSIQRGLPGHGQPIADVQERIAEIERHHQKRSQTILGELSSEQTVFALVQNKAIFPNGIVGGEVFLALVEILSHLEFLEETGKVERLEREGVGHFKETGGA